MRFDAVDTPSEENRKISRVPLQHTIQKLFYWIKRKL